MKALTVFCAQLCLLLALASPLVADQVRFDTLQAGDAIYRDVRVREVSPKWIVILHSGGIAQVPLEELSPELRARFGYNPKLAREFEETAKKKGETAREKRPQPRPRVETPPPPLEVKAEVDLRPRYFELGLHTKNQGRRPSCSVFAILGVLEFHYSVREEAAFFLSEEFLVWATRRINPGQDDFDGFSFGEVMAAIQRYGVARGDAMPNTLGVPISKISATGQAQAEAFDRRDVMFQVARGSTEAKIDAIIRELNDGFPVAVAMRWPHEAVVARVHTLRDQEPRPGAGHAVTLVGYHRTPEDLLFLFRNSYGPQWGMGGYGYVSDRYLKEHLRDVVTLRLKE